jgi:hypothetical protein
MAARCWQSVVSSPVVSRRRRRSLSVVGVRGAARVIELPHELSERHAPVGSSIQTMVDMRRVKSGKRAAVKE